jgi:hypothetical protein
VKTARLSAVPLVLWAAIASADRDINVDGSNADWNAAPAVATCSADPVGDGVNGIDIVRTCFENNNKTTNGGFLFSLYESSTNFPTSGDRYVGYYLDTNNDGLITSADEVWALLFQGKGTTAVALTVYDPISLTPRRSYATTTNCGGSGTANGWSGRQTGAVIEMSVAYGCLGLSAGNDNRLMQAGVYPNFDLTAEVYYDGTANTLTPHGPPTDLGSFTATAASTAVNLFWTNPTAHEGMLVLMATGAALNASAVPTIHQIYAKGQAVGNAVVVLSDETGKTAQSATVTGLKNGTRYYFKIFNHHQHHTYSAGNAPTSAGLFSEPSARSGATPWWCYSVGYPSMQQPVTELGAAVFTASNAGALTASRTTTPAPATDGTERWRPVQLQAAVQNRPLLVPLQGQGTTRFLITGDQSGRAYAVNSQTGALLWTGNGGTILGDRIQGQPVAQLYAYANAAFQAAHPSRDLIFVSTRNSSQINNKVYALNSLTGAVLWTYAPGNLDIVSGGMAVDYTRNRLYIAARSNSGGQASLRVLNSLTGAQLAALSLGDLDYGVNLDFVGGQAVTAYTINTAGVAYGVSLTTLATVWSSNIGVASTWIFPTGNGFIASLKSGAVRRYAVSGSTVSQVWTTAVTAPNGATVDYASGKIYVGSSDGKLRQLAYATGTIEKTLTVTTIAPTDIGFPTIDVTAGRLHVGTMDGRLCAFPIPLP